MEHCIFCQIVTQKIAAQLIYEDDDVIAFHDINPAAPVHFLIVPKEHLPTLAACSEKHVALLGKIALLAPRLAQQQGCGYRLDASGVKSGGFKTIINTGPDGGQEVYHLHMHVIGGPHPWPAKLLK